MDPVARALTGLLVGVGSSSGCEPETSCRRGTEACACTSDGACLSSLACISGYCVDPNWVPDGADDDVGAADDGEDGDSVDNVAACQAFVDAFDCGMASLEQFLDCETYASVACDVRPYFDCLADNTGCSSGIPDNSGWAICIDLASCS